MLLRKSKRLLDVLDIMVHPSGGLGYLFKDNASIASFNIVQQIKRYAPGLKTLFDVGANQGQFALAAKRFYSDLEIHSFEPVPETFNLLEKNTRELTGVSIHNYGLGSESGEISFYQNAHSHASSALPVSDFQKAEIPKTAKSKVIKVPIRCLNDVVKEIPAFHSPVLLKLDVQGFEKEVLKGGLDFLRQVDFLLFEASFVKMYEGEPLFEEMHEFVKDCGFELMGPVGVFEINGSAIPQMDMLYKKS